MLNLLVTSPISQSNSYSVVFVRFHLWYLVIRSQRHYCDYFHCKSAAIYMCHDTEWESNQYTDGNLLHQELNFLIMGNFLKEYLMVLTAMAVPAVWIEASIVRNLGNYFL